VTLPCRNVELRIRHRSTLALLGTLTPTTVQWTEDKAEAGALGFRVDMQDPVLVATPGLLEDRVVALATNLDPAAPATMTEVAWYLVNPGTVAVISDQHPLDVGDAQPTNRGLLALLDDFVVVHDGGVLRRLGGDTRYLGWMSAGYDATSWVTVTAATAEPWATDSTARGLTPGGPYPTAFSGLPEAALLSWIGAEDPVANLAVNARHALRGTFTLAAETDAIVYASADNYVTLFIDSELIYQQDETGDKAGWNEIQEPKLISLTAGTHVVGIIASNKVGVNYSNNPVGGICGIYAVDAAGRAVSLVYQTGATLADSQGAAASSATQWKAISLAAITGITAGWVIGRALTEAVVARASDGLDVESAALIHKTFSDTTDTAGTAWPQLGSEVGAIAVPVGTSGTELVERLGAFGCVPRLRPAVGAETSGGKVFALDAWVTRGTNRTATVALTRSNTSRYVADVEGVVATTIVVRHDEGWLLVTDAAAEATYGTRVVSLESGLSLDATSAAVVGSANLLQLKRLVSSATATIYAGAPDGSGPIPYTGFTPGDTINALSRTGATQALEVVSIAGDWTGDGDTSVVRWTLELKEPV